MGNSIINSCLFHILNVIVRFIMSFKTLRRWIQARARSHMFRKMKALGMDIDQEMKQLQCVDWEKEKMEVEDANVEYPDHFLREFHAYEKGNLCWEAAIQADFITLAVSQAVFPNEGLGADKKMRSMYHEMMRREYGFENPKDVLDLCCGTGISTRAMHDAFIDANVVGVDLSPYFLAVANYRQKMDEMKGSRLRYIHRAADKTGFDENSFDVVSISGTTHELTCEAMMEIFRESYRVLRRGGIIAIMDMDPANVQRMPSFVYTLFKSTEPYMDEYIGSDISELLVEVGFKNVRVDKSIPRRQVIIGHCEKE